MKTKIYMDNAATTPVRKEVLEAMLPYFSNLYGNASGVYDIARESKKALERARKQVALALGAEDDEICFTSGGSESDNLALKGVAEAYKDRGRHIITTNIEHHAILHTAKYLEARGFDVTYLKVDKYGRVSPDAVEKALRPDTILVSVMFANNEIGTIQPIEKIGRLTRERGILLHTDAVQAVGHIPIDVKKMNIDLLSLSGHKLGAPKGIGALYIRRGVMTEPLILGGSQENKRRAGTENIPSIVALGEAAGLAAAEMDEQIKYLSALRDKLIDGILTAIPHSRLNGHPTQRLPGNCNISFGNIKSSSLLLLLDSLGIAASGGSACTAASTTPSHVLLAIGLSPDEANGALRLTLNRINTEDEAELVLEQLPGLIEKLRSMSPLNK